MVSTLASACRKSAASAETNGCARRRRAAAAAAQARSPDAAGCCGPRQRRAGDQGRVREIHQSAREERRRPGAPPDRRDEIFRNALDGLVNLKLLSQEVKARGVTGDEQVVAEEIKKIRSRFQTEDEFTKALAAQQMTADRLKTEMQTQLGINKLMESEASGASPVTDTDVKDFYDKNPERFKKPEQVRASHILFKTEGDEAAKKKARASAESVLKQAKSGKDFAALAKEHSSDGSAQQGGDLGFFVKEQMVAEFSNAAFAMQPGQISDIVESQFGYHIIKVTERKAPEPVALDQVSPQVKQFLTQQRQKERADTFMKQLRSKAKIEVLI